MRYSLIVIFIALMCACSSTLTTPNSVQSLINHYGQPNAKISLANGHTYYVYSTESRLSYPYPTTSYAGLVVGPNGETVSSGVPRPSTDATAPLSRCVVTFEVDASGKVVGHSSKGSCVETDIIRSPY